MAEFGRTQVEAAPSPVTPLQPVQDESSVVAAQGIGQAIQTGLGIFTGAMESKLETKKMGVLNAYQQKQLKLATAVDQGKMTSAEARMRWRKNFSEALAANPVLGTDLRDISAQMASTSGLGKAVMESTQAEKEAAKNRSEASENGWLLPDMDEAQQKQAVSQYMSFKLQGQKLARDQAELDYEAKLVTHDSAKLANIVAKRKQQSISTLSTLADGYSPKFQRDMQSVLAQFNRGEIDQKEAYIQIQQHYNVLESTLRSVGKDAGGDYVANLISPMTAAKELTEQLVNGTIDQAMFDRQMQVMTNKQTAMMLKDPETVAALAASKLFPNSELILQPSINAGVVRYMKSIKPIDPTPGDAEEKRDFATYTSMLRQNMSQVVNGTASDLAGTKEELDKNVNKLVSGIAAYDNAVSNPTEYNQVVDFLASPEFGRYSVSNKLDSEATASAKLVLEQQYEEVVAKSIVNEYEKTTVAMKNEVSRKESIFASPRELADKMGERQPTTDVIEPVFNGSGVVFRARGELSQSGRMRLRQLNKTAAVALNRLIRMGAHLEGHTNYQQVYEKNYSRLFGVEEGSESKNDISNNE